jgi:hypothetical protein
VRIFFGYDSVQKVFRITFSLHREKYKPENVNQQVYIAFPPMIDEQIANVEHRYHRNSLQKVQNNTKATPVNFAFVHSKVVRDQ